MVAQFAGRAWAIGSPSPQTVCDFAFGADILLKRGKRLMNGVVAWVPPEPWRGAGSIGVSAA